MARRKQSSEIEKKSVLKILGVWEIDMEKKKKAGDIKSSIIAVFFFFLKKISSCCQGVSLVINWRARNLF